MDAGGAPVLAQLLTSSEPTMQLAAADILAFIASHTGGDARAAVADAIMAAATLPSLLSLLDGSSSAASVASIVLVVSASCYAYDAARNMVAATALPVLLRILASNAVELQQHGRTSGHATDNVSVLTCLVGLIAAANSARRQALVDAGAIPVLV